MRIGGLVVAVVVCGCFAQTPVIRFGGGTSAKQAQRIEVAKETPPALVANDRWGGARSVVTIRVWADDDYRAQNLRWQQTFGGELAYANEVLGPMLGIDLRADYRAWSHRAVPGTRLEATLEALGEHDPRTDVFVVVGLTSALSLVSETYDHLGVGVVGGRHLVIRGFADAKGRAVFERFFRDIGKAERESLYAQRWRHKTAAVLLHEIGHTLGATHDDEPDTLTSAVYSVRAAAFTTQSRDAMLGEVNRRLRRADPKPAAPAGAAAGTASAASASIASIVIEVDAAGAFVVGGVVLDDVRLGSFLRMNHADDPDAQVVFAASKRAPQHAVVRALDVVKFVGFKRVAVQPTDP